MAVEEKLDSLEEHYKWDMAISLEFNSMNRFQMAEMEHLKAFITFFQTLAKLSLLDPTKSKWVSFLKSKQAIKFE
jgi:hypothetical protein